MQNFINWILSLFGIVSKPLVQQASPQGSSVGVPGLVKAPIMIPGASGEVCYGPDESHYEPGINFDVLATDNAFTATKATQATNYVDNLFKGYQAAMEKTDLAACIYYHFFDPTVDPIAQAKFFLAEIGPLSSKALLALDFEPLPNKGINGPTPASAAAAQKFFDYVDKVTGQTTLLYCNWDYLQNYPFMKTFFATRPIWLAYPGHKVVGTPNGFPHVAIWQYTFAGTYKGVPQKIDGNIFFGNRQELIAWVQSLKLA